ncbi:MAG TPA: hypothetical protein VM760_07405 [Sphingomicrobium sp.]|jgi:hypothetical protein|nr:hypothetical protein [Sphingomicrobium sp.]
MSTLFTPPRYVPVDGNGNTLPGAKLYFYTTGTSTPKNTYSDAGLSVPNANPAVADGDGLFGPIYLASGDYKAILKDSADVTVWTVDPVPGLGAGDTLTTRGDLLTRDASGYKRLPVGAANYVLGSDGVDVVWRAPIVPRNIIQGLTYARNASDPTNDIDVAVGSAMDGTNTRFLVLGAGLTKRIDAAWAVGTGQGGLDTGSAADTDYYIWLIERADTGVVDVLFSTSATAPTMPANYSFKRLIGWFRRASSANVDFKTYEVAGGGLEFAWVTPRRDVNLATTLTTSRRTDVLSVPSTFSVTAQIRGEASNSGTGVAVAVVNPDETDAAPSVTDTPLAVLYNAAANQAISQFSVRTNASGAVASRASNTVDLYVLVTLGFIWSRR